MDAKAEYGGSAGNWTRTGADWTGAVLNANAVDAADAWAAVGIALGGVALCGCFALLCHRCWTGRAVEVAVTI
jgi:hypothetical protein